jgi:uncharacterized low-complexity protein
VKAAALCLYFIWYNNRVCASSLETVDRGVAKSQEMSLQWSERTLGDSSCDSSKVEEGEEGPGILGAENCSSEWIKSSDMFWASWYFFMWARMEGHVKGRQQRHKEQVRVSLRRIRSCKASFWRWDDKTGRLGREVVAWKVLKWPITVINWKEREALQSGIAQTTFPEVSVTRLASICGMKTSRKQRPWMAKEFGWNTRQGGR